MSTIQKTTLKRYNGTDWDPVYLANSADISYLGTGFTVASGEGFTVGQSVTGVTATATLLESIIDNLTKVDKIDLPAVKSGEAITALAANKLTGVVARANLPTDVGGKGVEVASEEAKAALTPEQVNVGDLVKVTGGKVYLVNGVSPMNFMELTDSASTIAWDRVTGTPTTLGGYGITDAVNVSEVSTTAAANKILKLNADGKLPASITGDAATLGGNASSYYATAQGLTDLGTRVGTAEGEIDTLQSDIRAIDCSWITTGVLDLARIPKAALENLFVVDTPADLANLTKEQVQNGDTVKVNSTSIMYFVVDDTKLGTGDYMQAFTEYTAGTASRVDWSGVQNHPTNLSGYGITDAVNSSEVVTTAAANKILKLNADAKLPASITGDAATLGSHAASYFATASDLSALDARVGAAEGEIDTLQGVVGDSDSGLVKDVATLQGQMTTAQTDIVNLKAGTAITALAASKLTGTVARANLPADVAGRTHKVADMTAAKATLNSSNAGIGDLVKCADGKVYVIVSDTDFTSDAAYEILVNIGGTTVAWSQITGTPTTLAGYGITDAVESAMLVTEATVANAGKVLKLNAQGKMDVDVTGSAAKLGGELPAYYAKQADMTAVEGRMTTAESDIDTLQSEIRAIDGSWITTGTIDIARLPHGALERCVVVADDTARFALTSAEVQVGDTVKVTATMKMYFVVDDTKLSTEAGYELYVAGRAAAVDWSGVENKPTTLAGYGITDAVNANEKVTVASAGNAGKILVLNANGKLDVDITGHVDWANINNKPESTVAEIDAAVEASAHTNRAVLDELSVDTDGYLCYDGAALAYKSELDAVALGALKVVNELPTDVTAGQLVLQAIS